MSNCGLAPTDLPLLGSLPSNKPLKQTSVYFPPLSSRSEQVCLESSDLLHMHLALAGTRFTFDYCQANKRPMYAVRHGSQRRVCT